MANLANPVIRRMIPSDWSSVAAIYRAGIDTRLATFETEVPDWPSWDRAHLTAPRLVAARGEAILGWAALSPVSARTAYRGVAEVSVYVAPTEGGRGVGETLLRSLVDAADEGGFWTLQASIFTLNGRSIRLHERCGFRPVGIRERIGCLDGEWLDTVILERRVSGGPQGS